MGSKERIHRLKENTKVNIINAAHEIVKEEGWQALSMRKIAEKIEYTAPMIYEYYANKEGILLELTKKGYLLLGEKMREARDKYDTPEEQLDAIWLAYWNFAFEEKEYYQLMFGLGMPCCDIDKCIPEKAEFRNLVMEPIGSMIKAARKKNVDACLKYHTFWSVLHGLVSIKMLGSASALETLNKLVLADAVSGFIKNLEN